MGSESCQRMHGIVKRDSDRNPFMKSTSLPECGWDYIGTKHLFCDFTLIHLLLTYLALGYEERLLWCGGLECRYNNMETIVSYQHISPTHFWQYVTDLSHVYC